MNIETGKVLSEEEVKLFTETERKKWIAFEIGETIEVRGIKFRVHDVSDQRLVLKFAK